MTQQPIVSCSESEDDDLLVPLKLMDGISLIKTISGVVPVFDDGFGLTVAHRMAELLHLASYLG